MDKIIINIKDHEKLPMFMEFLRLFQFIEVQTEGKTISKSKSKAKAYNLFDSAGIWENRKIDATQLRNQAWARKA
jgi:hypothetical protein